MNLTTTRIQMERKRGAASVQATFDEVYNLPDYLPDLFSVILTDAEVQMDDVKCGIGHMMVSGEIRYRVLYSTEQNGWKIACLEGNIPFQEKIAVEDMDEFDAAEAEPSLEDLSVRITNARKLSVRALLGLSASAWERYDADIPVGIEAEETPEMLIGEREFLELCYHGKENCRIREEIRLASGKPNIRQILWQQAQVFGLEERTASGIAGVQGEIQVFVVYAGEEGGSLQWLLEKVPFICEFDIPEADNGAIPYIAASVKNISCSAGEDKDGESRIILVEADLSADIRLYGERSQEILTDAYSLGRNLVLKKDKAFCAGLRMKNTSVCRVNDTIQIQGRGSDILQICAGFGAVETDRLKRETDGIRVEGAVRVRILYLTSSDNTPLDAAEGVLPFQYFIGIPGIEPDDEVKLRQSVSALSFLMKSSREAEVQAAVSLQAMVMEAGETEVIRGIEEEEFPPGERSAQPSVVGLRLTAEDSLWEIAKRYHTTTEEILKANHLETDAVSPGMKILIFKQVPEQP